MDIYRLYYCSLALQGTIGVLLAAWLWVKAGHQPGMKQLALFCVGVGMWGTGQLAINLGDDTMGRVGKILINFGPLNTIFFLHFVQRFLGSFNRRQMLAWYASALILIVVANATDMGRLVPWLGFRHFYVFPAWGWVPGLYVTLASAWAYLLLLMTWPSAGAKQRAQILALCVAGIWGSLSTVMFLNASFDVPIFPYSVILLPLYAVLLVFGLLRYDMMVVNLFANRVLAWLALSVAMVAVAGLFLSLAAQAGFAPLAALPLWQLWLLGSAMLGITLTLEGPTRRAMEKLVFPGTHLEGAVLAQWRAQLEAANDWQSLQTTARTLLESHLRQTIAVVIAGPVPMGETCIHCYRTSDARDANWRCDLLAWEGATPSVQRVGEMFGALLAAAAGRLDKLLQYTEQEKQRLQQAHLLELGGLAATVAHELRNPLNIISMAAVGSPEATRAEIRSQIERADHLIQDLLSYSGEVRIDRHTLNLAQLVRAVVAGQSAMTGSTQISIDVDESLEVQIDRLRGEQMLGNLLQNALAMLRGRINPNILIEAEATSTESGPSVAIRVCDNGAGVAPDLRADLFQPFKTRRPGGTGLGLAIVRRLAEAHGGSVSLIDCAGWQCCFEILLPVT